MINIASTVAVRPRAGLVWYNASKAAVVNATKGLAAEYGPKNVRVNSICPMLSGTGLYVTLQLASLNHFLVQKRMMFLCRVKAEPCIDSRPSLGCRSPQKTCSSSSELCPWADSPIQQMWQTTVCFWPVMKQSSLLVLS